MVILLFLKMHKIDLLLYPSDFALTKSFSFHQALDHNTTFNNHLSDVCGARNEKQADRFDNGNNDVRSMVNIIILFVFLLWYLFFYCGIYFIMAFIK